MRKFILGLAAAMMVATPAWAVTIRTDRSDSLYQNLGNSAAYSSVGQVLSSDPTGSYAASAVLIAPNWALTAAHVTDGATTMSFSVGGKTYSATNWVTNPNWTGNLSAGYDLGLIHFGVNVATDAAVTPATRYTGTAELGKVGTAVGFGTTGTGATGYQGVSSFSQLKKRGAQNMIDSLPNTRYFMSDFDNPDPKKQRRDNAMGSSTPLNLEGSIAPGDSGGGVFINIGGIDFLAGINSFISSRDGITNADYGDLSGHIRVSAFNSWIDSVLGGTTVSLFGGSGGSSGGTSLLAARSPSIPEPTAFAALSLMGLMLIGRRK